MARNGSSNVRRTNEAKAIRPMSTEIPIDTDDYEHRFGEPAGRAFWSFRIVSADPAIRDHIFTTRKPVIFKEACHEARELAKMRRSENIILVPTGALDDGT